MNFILDPGLVLYLPLYKLDGASFKSKDAYGHLCTVTGALWSLDGRTFDGTDDRISCGNHTSLNLTSEDFSGMAWVNPTDLSATPFVISKGQTNVRGWGFYFDAGGRLIFSTSQSGAIQKTQTAMSTIVINTRYSIGFTRSGADARVYVDGIDVTNSAVSHINPDSDANELFVGQMRGSGVNPLAGTIGECLLWNRKLTPQEIQLIHLATKWRYR